jgi:hypothetical protein
MRAELKTLRLSTGVTAQIFDRLADRTPASAGMGEPDWPVKHLKFQYAADERLLDFNYASQEVNTQPD